LTAIIVTEISFKPIQMPLVITPWLQNRPFEVRALGHRKWNGVSAEGWVWQVWEIATNTNINWLALKDG
jgi:hypothetical protein